MLNHVIIQIIFRRTLMYFLLYLVHRSSPSVEKGEMSKLWQESHTSPPKLITAWLLKSFSWLFTRISSTIPRLSASIKCILHQFLCVLLLTDWLSNLLDLLSNFWWLEFGAGRLALVVVNEWEPSSNSVDVMYILCLVENYDSKILRVVVATFLTKKA